MAKILITDDSTFMRNMIKMILEPKGYTFCEASNGNEMLKVYEEEKPDMVTLDITMPEMDGIEALRLLREKHPNSKVVMCSAMGQQAMVVEAVQYGAKDFLVKPFEIKHVYETIERVLKS